MRTRIANLIYRHNWLFNLLGKVNWPYSIRNKLRFRLVDWVYKHKNYWK